MRKKFAITLLLGTVLTANADDYNYLTVEQQDGTKTSLTATGLTITFDGGNLVAVNGNEKTTIALGTLSKMTFTATDQTNTDISHIKADEVNLNETDAVYDLSGRQLPAITQLLPKGIYILKKGNKATKIIIQ